MFKLATIAACLVCAATVAHAEDGDDVVGTEVIQVVSDAPQGATVSTGGAEVIEAALSSRAVSKGWLILPEGYELGSSLRFITSRASLGAMPLEFTDVAIATVAARKLLTKRAELSGSIDVLPKQPSFTDETVWQGASVAMTTQPWDQPLALWTHLHGGPMTGGLGYWGQLGLGADARKVVHQIMTFEGRASALTTYLLPDAGTAARAWLAEATIAGSVIVHDPEGWTGGWVGFDYSLPVVHYGNDPASGAPLDPQPRLDVSVGAVLTFADHWDVFTKVVFVDRGDLMKPATQLPILDGGFDQRQLIFGVTYHPRSRKD